MLLGERGFAQFRALRDTYGLRFQVKHLQVEIGAGPDSLQVNQVEALIAVLRESAKQTADVLHHLHGDFAVKLLAVVLEAEDHLTIGVADERHRIVGLALI